MQNIMHVALGYFSRAVRSAVGDSSYLKEVVQEVVIEVREEVVEGIKMRREDKERGERGEGAE